MNKILLGTILVLVIGFSYSEANATTVSLGNLVTGGVYTLNPDLITVDLSNECLTLIKHNDTSQCPTYKAILPYDNSNQLISGKFVATQGFFHRLQTSTVNHWGMYPPGKWTIMIDADYRAIVHSKEITIVPSLTFINKDDSVGNDHNRIEYQNRYVYPSCTGAEIVYSDSLLNDTIKYLESGCKTTSYDNKVVKHTPDKTPFDFKNPYSTIPYKITASKITTQRLGNCINNDKCTESASGKKW